MPITERPGAVVISSAEIIEKKVKYAHERVFGQFALSIPNVVATYEPAIFEYRNGAVQQHLPDYGLRNLSTGLTTYIELTRSPLIKFEIKAKDLDGQALISNKFELVTITTNEDGEEVHIFVKDPKSRERLMVARVEEEIGEKIPYRVLYKQQLLNIQRKHPELDFFAYEENDPFIPKFR